MIEKHFDKAKTSAQLMDSLRQEYAGNHEDALDGCPFSEQAIAYAFEELAPDVQQTMEDHLGNCRPCKDLVLYARAAEVESQAQAKLSPEVLPALAGAASRPPQLSLIKKIVGGAFMVLRIIAAPAAVVCFMLIISRLDVLDNLNFTVKKAALAEWSQSISNKVSNDPAARKKWAGLSGTHSQDDPSAVSFFSMHAGWSTDPFEPALGGKPTRAVRQKSKPRTPLEALDSSQLKLVGVMLSEKGNKALVEDASGKGHVIREGTYIGTNAGRVSRILKDRVIIEEEIEDVQGRIRTQKRIIKLNKP